MKKVIIISVAVVVIAALVIFFASQATPENVLTLPRAEQLEIKDGVIVISEKYTEIEAEAFAGRTDFSRVEIKGEADIGERCFYGCPNLREVITEKACVIGSQAFADCSSLKSVTVISPLSSCASDAFDGHGGLTVYCRENSLILETVQQKDISYKIIGE